MLLSLYWMSDCPQINRKCGREQGVPINGNIEEKGTDLKNLPEGLLRKTLQTVSRWCCPLGYVFIVSIAVCVSYTCKPFLPLYMTVYWNHNTEFVTPQLFPWQLATVKQRHCEDGSTGLIQSAILVCPVNSKLLERAHGGRRANTKSPALIRHACNESRNNDLQSSAVNEHLICYILQIIIY